MTLLGGGINSDFLSWTVSHAMIEDVLFYSLAWTIYYHSFSYCISPKFLGKYSIKYLKLLTSEQKAYWNMSFVSSSHALVISGFAVYTVIIDKFWSDWPQLNMNMTTPLSHQINHIANGYFLYDLCLTIYYRKEKSWKKSYPTVMIHHSVVFIANWSICHFNVGHAYALIGVFCELTTPFVNNRWLLHSIRENKTVAYFVNGIVLVCLWFLVRIILPLISFYPLWIDTQRGIEQSWSVFVIVGMTYTIIYPLQLYWFSKLIAGAIRAMKSLDDGVANKNE